MQFGPFRVHLHDVLAHRCRTVLGHLGADDALWPHRIVSDEVVADAREAQLLLREWVAAGGRLLARKDCVGLAGHALAHLEWFYVRDRFGTIYIRDVHFVSARFCCLHLFNNLIGRKTI